MRFLSLYLIVRFLSLYLIVRFLSLYLIVRFLSLYLIVRFLSLYLIVSRYSLSFSLIFSVLRRLISLNLAVQVASAIADGCLTQRAVRLARQR